MRATTLTDRNGDRAQDAPLDVFHEGLWAKLGRRGEATPHSVATHWTARLQDYLALFVHHQRPTKVLELTSRGQLLADIHAQALKAAGGPRGVPRSC